MVNSLGFKHLEDAWNSYCALASQLDAYAVTLKEKLLAGEVILASRQSGYRFHPPSSFQTVPLFVAERRPIEKLVTLEFQSNAEEPQSKQDEDRWRDGLDIAFDTRTREEEANREEFQLSRVRLGQFVRQVAQGGLKVLSGGPGSGKTYLAVFTAVDLCDHFLKQGKGLPILCTAESLVRELDPQVFEAGDDGYSDAKDAVKFAQAMVNAAIESARIQPDERRDCRLVEMLLTGTAVAIVDAIDQKSQDYDRLAGIINKFASTSLRAVLATGRPYAMEHLRPDSRFRSRYETSRWTTQQIQAFAAASGLQATEASALAGVARRQANAESVCVPQLLAFCVELLQSKKARSVEELVSFSRTKLFDYIVAERMRNRLNFVTPDKETELFGRQNRVFAFALEFWQRNQGGDLGRVQGKKNLPGPFADLVAAGLLANEFPLALAECRYEWSHRAVLEYFVGVGAANRILEKSDEGSQKEAIRQLASWGFDPECREVLRFAFGRLASDNVPLAKLLLAELSDPDKDDGGKTRLSVAALLSHEAELCGIAIPESVGLSRWAYGQKLAWDQRNCFMPGTSASMHDSATTPIISISVNNERDGLIINWDAVNNLAEIVSKLGDDSYVPFLIDALNLAKGSNWNSVSCTATALACLAGTASVPNLIDALFESIGDNIFTPSRVSNALRLLGNYSAVPKLIERLDSAKGMGWYAIGGLVVSLEAFGDSTAVPSLQSTLHVEAGSDWSSTYLLAEAIGTIGDKRAIDSLVYSMEIALSSLNDENSMGVWNAISSISRALGKIGSARTEEPLLKALSAAVAETANLYPEVRHKAIPDISRSISGTSHTTAVEILVTAFNLAIGKDWTMASRIASGMRSLGDPAAVPHLLYALSRAVNCDWEATDEIARAIGFLGDVEAVPQLISCLEVVTRHNRIHLNYIASVLGDLGDVSAIPALKKAYESAALRSDWHFCCMIAGALGRLGDEFAGQALHEVLQNCESFDQELAEAACDLLGIFGSKSAVPQMLEIADKFPSRSKSIVLSILRLEPQAHAILAEKLQRWVNTIVDAHLTVDAFPAIGDHQLSKIDKFPEQQTSLYKILDCANYCDAFLRAAATVGHPAAVRAFLDTGLEAIAPGIAFRAYSTLVQMVPRTEPRHWINGQFKRTDELVLKLS